MQLLCIVNLDLTCCLCRKLSTDKRCRKLHEDSCKSVNKELARLSIVPLESLVETSSPNTYLYSDCERQIASVSNIETKLADLRAEVRWKLSQLTNVSPA